MYIPNLYTQYIYPFITGHTYNRIRSKQVHLTLIYGSNITDNFYTLEIVVNIVSTCRSICGLIVKTWMWTLFLILSKMNKPVLWSYASRVDTVFSLILTHIYDQRMSDTVTHITKYAYIHLNTMALCQPCLPLTGCWTNTTSRWIVVSAAKVAGKMK